MGQSVSGIKEILPSALGGGGRGGSADSGCTVSRAVGGTDKSFTVEEALALQKALLEAFKEEPFQRLLRRAEVMHPRRGQRGHPDVQNFSTQLQGLLRHVYSTVLPRKPWCLEPGWQGVRQMISKMANVSEDKRVLQMSEEINTVLGLPKHTVLRPPAEEPVCVPTPDGSGSVEMCPSEPLLTDVDGDVAHEFWEEDLAAGELRRVHPPPPPPAPSAGQK